MGKLVDEKDTLQPALSTKESVVAVPKDEKWLEFYVKDPVGAFPVGTHIINLIITDDKDNPVCAAGLVAVASPRNPAGVGVSLGVKDGEKYKCRLEYLVSVTSDISVTSKADKGT